MLASFTVFLTANSRNSIRTLLKCQAMNTEGCKGKIPYPKFLFPEVNDAECCFLPDLFYVETDICLYVHSFCIADFFVYKKQDHA